MSQEPSLAARRAGLVVEQDQPQAVNPRQVHRDETSLRLSQNPSQQVRVSIVDGWGTGTPAL